MVWSKEYGITNSPSLNIITPEKGYTKENVRSINMNKLNQKIIHQLLGIKGTHSIISPDLNCALPPGKIPQQFAFTNDSIL